MIDEAKKEIDYNIEQERKTRQKKLKSLIKNKVALPKRQAILGC